MPPPRVVVAQLPVPSRRRRIRPSAKGWEERRVLGLKDNGGGAASSSRRRCLPDLLDGSGRSRDIVSVLVAGATRRHTRLPWIFSSPTCTRRCLRQPHRVRRSNLTTGSEAGGFLTAALSRTGCPPTRRGRRLHPCGGRRLRDDGREVESAAGGLRVARMSCPTPDAAEMQGSRGRCRG
jgi:hypothetical protein